MDLLINGVFLLHFGSDVMQHGEYLVHSNSPYASVKAFLTALLELNLACPQHILHVEIFTIKVAFTVSWQTVG